MIVVDDEVGHVMLSWQNDLVFSTLADRRALQTASYTYEATQKDWIQLVYVARFFTVIFEELADPGVAP